MQYNNSAPFNPDSWQDWIARIILWPALFVVGMEEKFEDLLKWVFRR